MSTDSPIDYHYLKPKIDFEKVGILIIIIVWIVILLLVVLHLLGLFQYGLFI